MKVSYRVMGLLLAIVLSPGGAMAEPAASPRAFCRAAGGDVQETGDPAVHICCYPARRRCVAVDERLRQTLPVVFPAESHSTERVWSGWIK